MLIGTQTQRGYYLLLSVSVVGNITNAQWQQHAYHQHRDITTTRCMLVESVCTMQMHSHYLCRGCIPSMVLYYVTVCLSTNHQITKSTRHSMGMSILDTMNQQMYYMLQVLHYTTPCSIIPMYREDAMRSRVLYVVECYVQYGELDTIQYLTLWKRVTTRSSRQSGGHVYGRCIHGVVQCIGDVQYVRAVCTTQACVYYIEHAVSVHCMQQTAYGTTPPYTTQDWYVQTGGCVESVLSHLYIGHALTVCIGAVYALGCPQY